ETSAPFVQAQVATGPLYLSISYPPNDPNGQTLAQPVNSLFIVDDGDRYWLSPGRGANSQAAAVDPTQVNFIFQDGVGDPMFRGFDRSILSSAGSSVSSTAPTRGVSGKFVAQKLDVQYTIIENIEPPIPHSPY